MTRRKDTLRKRNLQVKTSYQNRNSRIERYKQEKQLYETEKLQEKQLVLKIEDLPDELIRLIYDFLTGKAKLYFNPKYARLSTKFYFYLLKSDLESVFNKMSNIQILDLIYTGTLSKYPEVVEDLSYEYYFSIIDQNYHTVKGYHFLNLWATNTLSYDYVLGKYATSKLIQTEVDANIRYKLAMFIKNYILNALYHFQNYRADDLYNNNVFDYTNYRNLFVGMEKAYYLYKVVMRFVDKPIVEEVPMMHTTDPFSNELLIPTPLYLTI